MDEVLQLYETLNMFYILFGGCVLGLLGTNICTVGIMQFFKLQLFVNPRRFLITGNSVLCYLLLICRYLKSMYRNQCQIRSGFNSVGRFSSCLQLYMLRFPGLTPTTKMRRDPLVTGFFQSVTLI